MAVVLAGIETGDTSEFSSTSGASVVSTPIKGGSYAIQLSGGTASAVVALPAAAGEVWCRFWVHFSASPINVSTFAQIGSNATLRTNVDGKLQVGISGSAAAIGSTVLSATTWYRIDFRYKKGTGSDALAEVRLEGTIEATSTGGDAIENESACTLKGNASNTLTYDSIHLSDVAYPADGIIVAVRPNAVGDEDNFSNTFAEINDDPINDATGRTAPASGSIPFLNNFTTVSDISTINAFLISARANRSSGSGRTHHLRSKKSGGSAENSADLALGTGVAYYTYTPTTLPTTQADIDAWQAGGTQSAAGGRVMTITEEWLMLDYAESQAGLTKSVSDTVNNFAEALALNFGLLFVDSALNLSDLHNIVLGLNLSNSDLLDSLTDLSEIRLLGFQAVALTDNMDNFLDAILLIYGYNPLFTEALNFSDASTLIMAHLASFNDTFTVIDSQAFLYSYLFGISDSLGEFNDSLLPNMAYLLVINDNALNLLDSSTIDLGVAGGGVIFMYKRMGLPRIGVGV